MTSLFRMPEAGRDYSVSDMTSMMSTEALTLTPEPPSQEDSHDIED